MKLPPVSMSFFLLTLLLLWGGTSWVLSKQAKQQLSTALETIANGKVKDFFELEVLNYRQHIYGATVNLKFISNSALISEDVEGKVFTIEQTNGPIFINWQGVQLGLSRWQLNNDFDHSRESVSILGKLLPTAEPIGIAVVTFFDSIDLNVEVAKFGLSNWLLNDVVVTGFVDAVKPSNDFRVHISELTYQDERASLRFADISLESASAKDTNVASKQQLITTFSLNANDSEIVVKGRSSKIPFNVQSRGSLWANNDTLSGDLLAFSGNSLLQTSGAINHSVDWGVNISLQFRDFLTGGFWEYLSAKSDISSLLQQADWAMEDVETPEQQDFLRSLFVDVGRVQTTQADNPLKPLLVAGKSRLALQMKLNKAISDVPSQLLLSGFAAKKISNPSLVLTGEASVQAGMLNDRWLKLIDGWCKKGWFRRYEAGFESDISVMSEQLLLNDFIVSVDGFKAELSQTITDQ